MKEKIILGTYTRKESQGIYQVTLDKTNKELTNLELVLHEDNPTYLGVAANDFLYTITKEGETGGMASYQPDGAGNYTLVNRVMEEGAPPCYVGIDNERQLVFGANYHRGEVNSYKIAMDGSLKLVTTVKHTGKGPHENQKSPHAHYADLTPDKRLVVCDLGTDEVYTYEVAPTGELTEVAVFKAAPGTGPRHLVFHPNGQTAYLLGELANTLVVLNYDSSTGELTEEKTVSTLPTDFADFSAGGAIRITAAGDYIYASNRGHNSLAVFKTHAAGKDVTLVQIIASEGDFPRDFALNQTEEFLVAGHQNSDNLTLFQRSAKTGELELIQKDVYAPETVCTYFV